MSRPRARSLALLSVLALATVIAALTVGPAPAAAQAPIKIGLLLPYTGPFAMYGNDIIEPTIKMYLDEIKYMVGNRKIELVIEDDEAKPDVGVTKVRKLVERDQVHMVVATVHSGVAYAIREYLVRRKVPYIIPLAAAKNLTQKDRDRYIFGVRFAGGQLDAPGAWWAYHQLGLRRVLTIGQDYAAPREMLQPFTDGFTQLGGKVVKQIWHPTGTNDFSAYLTEIKALKSELDAVSPMIFGTDSIRFVQQYKEFGVGLPIYANGDVYEQTFLDKMGDAAIGAKTYWHYSPMRETPENKRFVAQFKAKTGRLPGAFAAQAYTTIQAIVMALKAIDGRAEDKERFVDALEKVKFESPAGPFEFDEHHGWRFNVYLQEVKKVGGVLAQYPLGPVIPSVDQFWTLDRMKK
jgi:branched-chain amino acid transport system substrate-binding protein